MTRLRRLPTITADGYRLTNGVAQNLRHPDTFWIPSERDRNSVMPGDVVKLGFDYGCDVDLAGERMWVIVQDVSGKRFIGILDSHPHHAKLRRGSKVVFCSEHIIDIYQDEKRAVH